MKPNVGSLDKIIRLVLGLGILALFFVLPGGLRWLGLIGLVPLLTAAAGFCPLYRIIGISSCPKI